jgi:acyl-lipid omega-6 desaturase (Delta-12 desaturase)
MQVEPPSRAPSPGGRRPTNLRGFAWILGESACTGISVGLALLSFARIGTGWGWLLAWILSELVLGLLLFQWFVLMHGCAHRSLFSNRVLNDVFGHVASLVCLVPYFSWRYVHSQHHRWVGWMDRDPTTAALSRPPPSPGVQRLVNFCWRFWIPIFSLVFGVSVFWNARSVAAVAPSSRQRRRTWFSILFVATVYGGLVAVGGGRFFAVWTLAFVFYLTIADPILLSQHAHLPLLRSDGAQVTSFNSADQDRFSRTLVVPKWVARWVVLQFTNHGVHHAYPNVAHYDIDRIPFTPSHPIGWAEWLRVAKRMSAVRLMYESSRETGITL